MKQPLNILLAAACAFLAAGCLTTGGDQIELVNNMAVEKDCQLIVSRTGSSHHITLPSVSGAGGVTVNLGKFESDPQVTAKITDAAIMYEDGLIHVCMLKKEAAYNNDAVSYKKCQQIEIDNLGKLEELNKIAAAPTPGPEVAPGGSPAAKPHMASAVAKAKPKTKPQMFAAWLKAYGPAAADTANKNDQRFIQSQGMPTAVGATATATGAPEPPAPAPVPVSDKTAALLAIPKRDPAYFGL